MTSFRVLFSSIAIVLVLLCGTSVANGQLISPSPQALVFTYQIGGPNPAAQSVYLSADAPSQFGVTVSGAPWLSVTPMSGVTPNTLIATVTAPPNATAGTLSGSIIIGPPASTDAFKTVVSVTLQILAPPQGNLYVSPDHLFFDYQSGGPYPAASGFQITSSGSPASFNLSTSANWLTTSTNSFVTPATVWVSVLPSSGMAPGTYTGFIHITPNYAGGVAKQVTVTLQIYSAGSLMATPNNLAFNYQPGGALPASQWLNIVNSAGGAVSYFVTASTTSGGAWLSYSPNGGTTPSSVVISVNPANLAGGTYYGLITIAPTSGGAAVTQVPVTLTVYSTSQLVVEPASLTFNYQSGGPNQTTQYLSVKSTGNPVNYTVSVQGPSWTTVTVASGVTPSGFGVNSLPPSSTPAGTYVANVLLTPVNGGGSAVTIPVTTYVTAANYLTVGRSSVSFDYTVGGANPAPVIVPVTSSSGSLKFEAAAATVGFGPWLTVSQSSQYTPANLTIGVAPQGLAPGTYSGNVAVNSADATNGTQSIAVTLVVTQSTSFVASPFGLVFSYQMNMEPAKPQAFTVSAMGSSVAFTLSTTTTTGGNWLMAVGNGTTPATVAVGVNAGSLGPGTYTGQIQITSTDSSVPALQMPVVFNVSPGPVFLPSASQVVFQYQTGFGSPIAQTATINTNTGDAAVFYPTILTADGGSWLSVSPDIGTTPTSMTLSVNPQGLTAGLHYAVVALNDTAGAIPISFVPVTLQISDGPILGVPAQSLLFTTQTGTGAIPPQTITVNTVGASAQFRVTTFGGGWLQTNPASGNTGSTINVTVSPSGMAAGYYLGVVQIDIPGVANSQQLVPVVLSIAPGF